MAGKNGGARPGAGRKPKADEEKVRVLATNAIIAKFGSIEKGMVNLIESGEPALVKFVWEHAVGKPREKMDVDLPEGIQIVLKKASGS